MNITVLGAGAWGTALAVQTCAHHPTVLWARNTVQVAHMRASCENAVYLPGVALPAALRIESDLNQALIHVSSATCLDSLVVVATPMAGLAEMLMHVANTSCGVLWLCKGLEHQTGRLGHEIARAQAPNLRAGVLSGPSFAIEVAQSRPTALVAASVDTALCEEAVTALHTDSLRVYTCDDPVGVEVGGAVKNVLAIATGIADGLQLGLNARAALITRGLAEMTRLGVALGARAETFMGLSGLGDLVLTATGDLSRNRTVGQLLAQKLPLARILTELGHVAEGVNTAPMVLKRAQALGVDMPITGAVVAVLNGHATPVQAVEQLMGRGARAEANAN
jgi:glycerol-3-phosphate dehydrogenase (NAD(P)+)